VVAANGDDGRVRDRALLKNDQVARSCAEIGEADAEFAFVGPQDGIGT